MGTQEHSDTAQDSTTGQTHSMVILHTVADLRQWRWRDGAAAPTAPVVLVPTMGALHEGHLELMRHARVLAGPQGRVAVSIFVNPLQFGPKEDFSKYPRELEADADKCRSVGVDMIFAPEAAEVYAADRSVMVLETRLSKVLCGASRPGHFDGVCTVVLKLFNLVQPDVAVFGKKDWQQLAIIRRMVRDLDVPVQLVGGEIVRENDGLAMSSRNRYLGPEERGQAAAIRQGLLQARLRYLAGEREVDSLLSGFRDFLADQAPLHQVDYIQCVHQDTLEPQAQAGPESLLAAAVLFGRTRLIDNLELNEPSP